jgi:MFS family permease
MTDTISSAPVSAFRRKLTIGLYIGVVFLYWTALYVYVPALPTYVQGKAEGNLAMVGTVLAMYGLWQAVVRLPLGILVDWLGRRKPFIIIGLALAGLGAWLMGSAGGVPGLLLGRSITGLAAAAWVPLLIAFSSLFPPQERVRATVILTVFHSISRLLATSVTGSLINVGGDILPFTVAAFAATLGILCVLPVWEQARPRLRPSVGGIGRLITRPEVLLPALLAAVVQYADFSTTFGFFPILAKQLGGSHVTQSLLVSLYMSVVIGGNLSATFLMRRLGARRMIYGAFGLLGIGLALAAFAPLLAALVAAQICVALAVGMSYPILMGLSIRFVAEAEQNTAMGLHQSVYAIGMFSGPWLSGLIASVMGLPWMMGVTSVAVLALGLAGSTRLAGRE